MTILTGRHVCSWTYPACILGGTRLFLGIPLCERHYAHVARSVARKPPAVPDPEAFRHWESVVYYVTWPSLHDDQVKIGVSGQLSHRLLGLRRRGVAAEVLVAEPGDGKGERRRHRQFGSLRLLDPDGHTTELFRRAPELDEHIVGLREQHPDWAVRSKL